MVDANARWSIGLVGILQFTILQIEVTFVHESDTPTLDWSIMLGTRKTLFVDASHLVASLDRWLQSLPRLLLRVPSFPQRNIYIVGSVREKERGVHPLWVREVQKSAAT